MMKLIIGAQTIIKNAESSQKKTPPLLPLYPVPPPIAPKKAPNKNKRTEQKTRKRMSK